jgi:hypothetical protein
MPQQEVLGREREIFEAHLEEWRRSHLGEFVVLKGDEIVGFYPTLERAFGTGTRRFGLEPFFVHQIVPVDTVNVSFFGRLVSA